MLSHQQKKIDHASMLKATELFQFIYTDLNSPYPSIWDSHKYYISFFNDYFSIIHIYFLKNKNEVFFKFKEYRVTIELQSGKKIKFLCSDDEDKYKNLKFEKFLKKTGI